MKRQQRIWAQIESLVRDAVAEQIDKQVSVQFKHKIQVWGNDYYQIEDAIWEAVKER